MEGYKIACDRCGGFVSPDEIVYNEPTNEGLCPWCEEEPDISLVEQVFINFKEIFKPPTNTIDDEQKEQPC